MQIFYLHALIWKVKTFMSFWDPQINVSNIRTVLWDNSYLKPIAKSLPDLWVYYFANARTSRIETSEKQGIRFSSLAYSAYLLPHSIMDYVISLYH